MSSPMKNGQMSGDQADTMDTLKKVLKAIEKYKFLLIVSIVLAGVSVILQLYVPVLFGNAIDGIIAQGHGDRPRVRQRLSFIVRYRYAKLYGTGRNGRSAECL